ncbi:pantetheine-phosphate adenylyltransferase [Micrococcales bacterium 31B]|nr:pantetheine-phosphate adenylyltransferase [Micrococcales bacterium 31B]
MLAGSFDPISWGHVDILARGCHLLDEVHVVVTHNPSKQGLFTLPERQRLVTEALAEWDENHGTDLADRIVVHEVSGGLLATFAQQHDIAYVIRGLRSGADFEYERPMAAMNDHLADLETIFFAADQSLTAVSSSLVKEVAQLGGDISPFVPTAVARALEQLRAERAASRA